MTIEHLLPEAATKTTNAAADDVANIGNLILMDEQLNSDLGDKSFKENVRTRFIVDIVAPVAG